MPENKQLNPATATLQAQLEDDRPVAEGTAPTPPATPVVPASEPLAQAMPDQPAVPVTQTPVAPSDMAAASEPLAQPLSVPAAAPASSPSVAPGSDTGVVVTTPVRPPNGGAAAPQTFLTGSGLAAEQETAPRPRLPWGVYVIVGLNLIGFMFANTVADGTAGFIALGLQCLVLAVSIGLVFRFEPARKVAAILATASTVLAVIIAISMFGTRVTLDNNALTGRHRLEESLAHTNASASQRRALDNELARMDEQRAVTDRALAIAGVYNLASAVIYSVQAVYLRRPHVRAAFHKLQA